MFAGLSASRDAAFYKSPRTINIAFYRKAEDEIYSPVIRQVIDKRPTYGYKRVTSLVNSILRGSQRAEINRKREYRLMKIHGLIFPKSGEKRVNHVTQKNIPKLIIFSAGKRFKSVRHDRVIQWLTD